MRSLIFRLRGGQLFRAAARRVATESRVPGRLESPIGLKLRSGNSSETGRWMCHVSQDIPNATTFDRHSYRVARARAGCKASRASIRCGWRKVGHEIFPRAHGSFAVSIRMHRIAAWRAFIQGVHQRCDVIFVPQHLVDVRLFDCIKKQYRLGAGRLKVKSFERIAKSVERPAYDVRQPSDIGGRMQAGMEPRQAAEGCTNFQGPALPVRPTSNSFSQQLNNRS